MTFETGSTGLRPGTQFESLSGRVGVKRFQAAPSIWCGMSLAGSSLLFGIGIWAFPMMGSGGCGGISRGVLAASLRQA